MLAALCTCPRGVTIATSQYPCILAHEPYLLPLNLPSWVGLAECSYGISDCRGLLYGASLGLPLCSMMCWQCSCLHVQETDLLRAAVAAREQGLAGAL